MPDDTVLAPFHPWILAHLAECSKCSALVPDHPEAKLNHERWHATQREIEQLHEENENLREALAVAEGSDATP
jgi:hypothetical protein